jgi:hypothetical protein
MDDDNERLLDEIIETVVGDKMVAVMPALLQMKEDAERYRWLKANHLQTGPDSWIRTGDDLEEAIDAARSGK